MSENMPRNPRSGFTLIELLVVIVIIAIIVGLTLPAVQSAREASRRSQCLNNLRQIGIALSSYLSLNDAFPIGYIAWSLPPDGVAPGWAWSAAVLPQLEQSAIYAAANISVPVDGSSNATARTATQSVYICPSDRNFGAFFVSSRLAPSPVEARTTSYAANGGAGGPGASNGLFLRNKIVRPKDIKDGLSATFAIGERGSFMVQNAWAGALSDGRGGGQVLAHVPDVSSRNTNVSSSAFTGPHPGLTHFLMGDGSARPIKASVNASVYRALATRNGREPVDQSSY